MWQNIGMFVDKPFWATVVVQQDDELRVMSVHATRKEARVHRARMGAVKPRVMQLEVAKIRK